MITTLRLVPFPAARLGVTTGQAARCSQGHDPRVRRW